MASWKTHRHDLQQNALIMLGSSGQSFRANARYNEEHMRLAHGWHQLDVAVKLSCRQHKEVWMKVEISTAEAMEAGDFSLHKAEEAVEHHYAVEAREQEL